ncbi:MAG: hypothetical protein QMD46_12325 [Methanomicrobiales archaeon]|nr:hypothetical protein [Methanomicrobiales archaeon]MDI6877534.1 hypothetical protein [Methanomicrobiales archaeon]
MKTFQDGDALFGAMVTALMQLWPEGSAVVAGCTPSGSGTARQVTVGAGTVTVGGTAVPVYLQTKTLDAATFDRYDLIGVNNAGTVTVTKGTETRRVPAIPANTVPIAIALVEVGQTTMPADRLLDGRVLASVLPALAMKTDTIGEVTPGGGVTIDGALIKDGQVPSFATTVAGDTLRFSDDAQVMTSNDYYTVLKSFVLPDWLVQTSTLRVRFDLRGGDANDRGYARIYYNGVAVGTERSVYGEVYQTFTEDIPNVGQGRTVALCAKRGSYVDYGAFVRNFRIYSGTITPVWGFPASW